MDTGLSPTPLTPSRVEPQYTRQLVELARSAISARLSGRLPPRPPTLPAALTRPRGVVVRLWSPGRELRGSCGHLTPLRSTLAEEIADCAAAAATRDPGFPPVSPEELDSLDVEIGLVDALEPVSALHELDPTRSGLVLQAGARRAVVLPCTDGCQTPAQQLKEALRRAGVRPDESYHLQRFGVWLLPSP